MKKIALVLLMLLISIPMTSQIKKHKMDSKVAPKSSWTMIGDVKAGYGNDHDALHVQGPFDNFRKVKLRISNADVNMDKMVITYDSGVPDNIPLKFVIRQGEESRTIDLPGRKRSIRKIEFWYDTKGVFSGKAKVTVFGKR